MRPTRLLFPLPTALALSSPTHIPRSTWSSVEKKDFSSSFSWQRPPHPASAHSISHLGFEILGAIQGQ
ncbi:hypothetical protein L1987_00602 [Smallanthus sonchifolius]|uniref:Uncharacterized protein n=1 Tax=Smallanthus sonchifolius TaxID=185202 RepID=A0ACB9K2R8_9ASTR|nr:hypothetical protein L1987_00602 [Smallanthus sonchifolius]